MKHLANLLRGGILGLTAALPVYATGPTFDDRTLQVAFLGPLLGYLAIRYNARVSDAMMPPKEGTP